MKQFAIRTAKKAGIYLLENFRKHKNLAEKRGLAKEITTKYDKVSDALIIKEINKRYPKHNILTEESGFIDKKSEYTWIVDSLDGTTNFSNSNPFFSVSIALMKNNELLLGVIYAPFLKELFVAEKGKGSFLNGKRIHATDTSDIKQSYFLSCEGGDKTNRRISKINAKIHGRSKDMRKLGAASLEGAWVACGRAEAYIVTEISEWDVASAVLLVKEARGKVTDFKGKEWKAKKSDLIFSNEKIHSKILNTI